VFTGLLAAADDIACLCVCMCECPCGDVDVTVDDTVAGVAARLMLLLLCFRDEVVAAADSSLILAFDGDTLLAEGWLLPVPLLLDVAVAVAVVLVLIGVTIAILRCKQS
jgi:hypothetical protein